MLCVNGMLCVAYSTYYPSYASPISRCMLATDLVERKKMCVLCVLSLTCLFCGVRSTCLFLKCFADDKKEGSRGRQGKKQKTDMCLGEGERQRERQCLAIN